MLDANHRAYVLRWAASHWKRDNTQPRDMDVCLERAAVEIVAIARSRMIWTLVAVAELAIIFLLTWMHIR